MTSSLPLSLGSLFIVILRPCYVDQAGLELAIFLHQAPECRIWRYVPPTLEMAATLNYQNIASSYSPFPVSFDFSLMVEVSAEFPFVQ